MGVTSLKKIRWLQILSMAFIVWLLIVFTINLSIDADVIRVGEEASDFELEGFDGEMHQLSTYTDKPTVLYFFASWCSTCKRQTPEMVQLQEELGDDINLLTIVRAESKRAVEKYIKETGHDNIEYLFDFDMDVSNQYGIIAQPEIVIIDGNGKVVEHIVGPMNKELLVERIGGLID